MGSLFAFATDMRWLLLFLFCFSVLHLTDFGQALHGIAGKTQELCLRLVHRDSPHSGLSEAYFCGKELADGEIKDLFCDTSLYHLIVVSGSHLILLTFLMRKVGIAEAFITFLLFPYALATGLAPPVFRAFLQRLLALVSELLKWQWKPVLCILFAGILCLAFFPDWLQSSALQLSLGCSIAMALGHAAAGPKILLSATASYLFLVPLLQGWAQVHPLGILMNLLIAPFLAFGLWGIGFIWLFNTTWGDFLYSGLIQMLREMIPLVPKDPPGEALSPAHRWSYIFILATAYGMISVVKFRNRLKIKRMRSCEVAV